MLTSNWHSMSGYALRNHEAHSVIVSLCKLGAVVSDTPWMRLKIRLWNTTLETACSFLLWIYVESYIWSGLKYCSSFTHVSSDQSDAHNIQACGLIANSIESKEDIYSKYLDGQWGRLLVKSKKKKKKLFIFSLQELVAVLLSSFCMIRL
jgi:hypothetical protein